MLAAERYDGAEPVNLGTGVEIAIRDLVELVAELTGFEGEIVWDTSKPNGQPRRRLDVTRAEELFGFRAQPTSRGARADDRLVPRERPGACLHLRPRPRQTQSASNVGWKGISEAGATLARLGSGSPIGRCRCSAGSSARPVARAARVRPDRPPQRLALLPGRRPDQLHDGRVAARERLPAAGDPRLGLAVRAAPVRLARRARLRLVPALRRSGSTCSCSARSRSRASTRSPPGSGRGCSASGPRRSGSSAPYARDPVLSRRTTTSATSSSSCRRRSG